MRKSLALCAATIALAAGHAFAADLRFPPPGPGYLPPAFLPPALPNWSGCYAGANLGGAWAKIDEGNTVGGTLTANPAGIAGGGQVGCDIQFDSWVFGIRNMIDATNLRSSTSFAAGSQQPHQLVRYAYCTRRLSRCADRIALRPGRRGLDQYQRDFFQHRRRPNRQHFQQQSKAGR